MESETTQLSEDQTPKPARYLAVYLLTFVQIVLSFVLGIFGNKVAEIVEITPQMLLISTIAIILLLLIVTVMLLNYQTNNVFGFPPFGILTTGRILPGEVVTTFPFAVVLGATIQFLFILILSRSRPIDLPPISSVNSYEILTGISVIATLLFFKALRHDLILMLAYCCGLAIGITATLILLRPYENTFLISFGSWLTVLLIFGFLFRSNKVRQYIHSTIESLTKDEKEKS